MSDLNPWTGRHRKGGKINGIWVVHMDDARDVGIGAEGDYGVELGEVGER
jgi:hypothetical protein